MPGSVEARAKMNMTPGQSELLPSSRSSLVLESWRATGFAAARPAVSARMVASFMMNVLSRLVVWGQSRWA